MRITKLHILLICLLLLIAFGSVSYFLSHKKFQRATDAYVIEPVITPTGYVTLKPTNNTTSWKTFSDETLHYSVKYPSNVIIDTRQTVEGHVTVFIFSEDKTEPLPGQVTSLYIANTNRNAIDGFSAFQQGDCGTKCNVSYKKVTWVTVNNVYGVKNPLPNDNNNYYFTDKKQSGPVINVYVGGYVDTNTKGVKEKIATFEEIIKTINFDR